MWLHIPKHLLPTSPSSPASAPSTSPSDEFFQALAASSSWRGKPRLWRLWRLAWRRATWMPRRFGATYARSQQAHSEAVLAWWSAAFPARTSASQGRAQDWPASGQDSSSTSWTSFATFDPGTSSWRTSQQSLFEDSTPYSDRWPKAGSMRSGAVSKRPTLARLTAEIAGGSSRGTGGNWPTPRSRDGDKSPRNVESSHGPHLTAVAAHWQTPSVADTTGGHLSRGGSRSGELLLRGQAKQWATPTTRDWKDGACSETDVPTNALLGRQAVRATVGPDSHPDQTTETDGAATSPATPTSRLQLNERFVEVLMGLPPGWTDFAALETPLCRPRQTPHCGRCGSAPSESDCEVSYAAV